MPPVRHLYFHIPFCAALCPYCSFFVDTQFRHKSPRFVGALLREVDLQKLHFDLVPETIYLGGGTPTALSPHELELLLTGLAQRLDLSGVREWTIEINPATVSPAKARLLRDHGVTRVSMGVQSWNEETLRTLGRRHSGAQARQTYETLRTAGFASVNLDLMFAVPGQTMTQWLCTLEETIALAPEHISTYCLTYEEDTEFFRRCQSGTFTRQDETEAAMFEAAMDRLGAAGYEHYEISNHARSGCRSLHNLACWRGLDYLGFGPSAFSTCAQHRWQNVADTAGYITRLEAGELPVSFTEDLPPQLRRGEQAAFGLRLAEGVPTTQLAPWPQEVSELTEAGLLEDYAGRTRLTRRGRLLADTVGAAFIG
jgi:oxygen-independent coproporphyrinogen III oxidase